MTQWETAILSEPAMVPLGKAHGAAVKHDFLLALVRQKA